MSAGPEPAASSTPDKDVWRRVGEWRLEGDRLYIGDSWAIFDGLQVPATPGVYDIEARIFFYGSDERVASLRGWLRESTPDGEKEAGEFGVDVASAGVIDATALDRWRAADEAGYGAWQQGFSESGQPDLVGFYPCEAIGSSMVFTSTGFGDGSYRVSLLTQGDKPVGFEAHFLEEGQRYFDEAPRASTAERPRVAAWKAVLIGILTLTGAAVALVIGVVLGLFGWLMLKGAQLLSRLFGK